MNLNGKQFKVDGVDLENKIVYEFLGEYWHGHPNEVERTKSTVNKRCKKSFEQLFNETEQRFNILKLHNYKIVYRWSKENEDRVFNGKLDF